MTESAAAPSRNRFLTPALLAFGTFALVFGALHFLVVRPMARKAEPQSVSPAQSPALGTVPPFSLVTEHGTTLTNAALRGKIWIADFVFLRCSESCPAMTTQMKSLVERLNGRPEIRFVSFDVDPDHDTVADLLTFSKSLGADPARWSFLHGRDRNTIRTLSREGFKLGLDGGDPDDPQPILHSSRFALVDREGMLRATYDGSDPEDVKRLLADTLVLADKSTASR
ncbi:MAG: SCO family protein [Thermoanaerobaculia bacterium]